MSSVGIEELGSASLSRILIPATDIAELGPGGFGRVEAATITIVYPEIGTAIFRNTVIAFTVTGYDPALTPEVQCDQGLTREIVHDGAGFLYPYLGSVRFVVDGILEYQIRRSIGWETTPVFRVKLNAD